MRFRDPDTGRFVSAEIGLSNPEVFHRESTTYETTSDSAPIWYGITPAEATGTGALSGVEIQRLGEFDGLDELDQYDDGEYELNDEEY